MIDTVQAVDAERRGIDGRKRVIALLFLLLISLLALRSSYTIFISTYLFSSNVAKNSSSTGYTSHQLISSKTLPIYLIDTSNINSTTIAASTWGEISTNWNRTTQYSNLLSFATAVPSLPNQQYYNTTISNKKRRRQIIIIHCGPKLGSTTLRGACVKNLERTCPQMVNFTIHDRERRSHAPPGYFGGDRLVAVMNECVDTHYFCVSQVKLMDLIPSANNITTAITSSEELDDTVTTSTTTAVTLSQNVQYIHLFPFRNYNDWVKSAIKQQYDRAGEKGCRAAKRFWANGKCQHSRLEIDIRKYSRVDLDRFQDGIVKQRRRYNDKKLLSGVKGGRGQEGNEEQHTILLYLHRDLQRTMRELSTRYQLPMLPGTGKALKGKRPKGTCNESLVELYHECFSDSLMEFDWDLPENQLHYNRAPNTSSSLRAVNPPIPTRYGSLAENLPKTNHLVPVSEAKLSSSCTFCKILNDPELVVVGTDGNTCRSIQLLAAKEVNGSGACAIMQKEERVCCPGLG